jgi:hypothetical protein
VESRELYTGRVLELLLVIIAGLNVALTLTGVNFMHEVAMPASEFNLLFLHL